MSKIRTHYDNLKVAHNAPDSLIKASYEALIQSFQNMEPEETAFFTKVISESYEVLHDPVRRAIYDRWITTQEATVIIGDHQSKVFVNPYDHEECSGGAGGANLDQPIEYAGFLIRASAITIDVIIFSVIILLVIVVLSFFSIEQRLGIWGLQDAYAHPIKFSNEISYHILEMKRNLYYVLGGLLLYWCYFGFAESSCWQATVGKKLQGLKTTDKLGNKISLGQANIRFFVKLLTVSLIPIVLIIVAFTKKKRGLHDKMAGTLVVKTSTHNIVAYYVSLMLLFLFLMLLVFGDSLVPLLLSASA